ncbi:FAD-dependent oxidoreductase, partial [Salmonella enterica]
MGAGVIGVTTAYRLLQDGHQVSLIDARQQPGEGTSQGNGAQLSYSYVAPLA